MRIILWYDRWCQQSQHRRKHLKTGLREAFKTRTWYSLITLVWPTLQTAITFLGTTFKISNWRIFHQFSFFFLAATWGDNPKRPYNIMSLSNDYEITKVVGWRRLKNHGHSLTYYPQNAILWKIIELIFKKIQRYFPLHNFNIKEDSSGLPNTWPGHSISTERGFFRHSRKVLNKPGLFIIFFFKIDWFE